jgi:DNA primase
MTTKNHPVDFRDIKSRVTMEMVLRRYGVFDRLKDRGDNHTGVCPIHGSGSNPNQFSVSLKKNVWNCFGDCKAGGNVLDFVAKKEGVSIRKAALLLQDWFGSSASRSAPASDPEPAKPAQARPAKEERPVSNPPLKFTLKNLAADHPWLAERGIDAATAEHFGIGFFAGRGILSGRIAIPIYNQRGDLVAYAGRAVNEEQAKAEGKYKLPAGFNKSLEIYNGHRLAPGLSLVILVESFLSVWALHQAGFPAVAALMGSSLSEAQAETIAGLLGPAGRLLLLLDADPAGQACAADCLARLGHKAWVRALDLRPYGPKPHQLAPDQLHAVIENACQ